MTSAETFTADQGHSVSSFFTGLETVHLNLLGKATSTGCQLLLSVLPW